MPGLCRQPPAVKQLGTMGGSHLWRTQTSVTLPPPVVSWSSGCSVWSTQVLSPKNARKQGTNTRSPLVRNHSIFMVNGKHLCCQFSPKDNFPSLQTRLSYELNTPWSFTNQFDGWYWSSLESVTSQHSPPPHTANSKNPMAQWNECPGCLSIQVDRRSPSV